MDRARAIEELLGKILRIDVDGLVSLYRIYTGVTTGFEAGIELEMQRTGKPITNISGRSPVPRRPGLLAS